MLRITEKGTEHGTWLILEDQLSGPSVDKVKRCWKRRLTLGTGRSPSCAGGRTLLTEMQRTGTEFTTSGVFMKCVVRELTRVSRGHRSYSVSNRKTPRPSPSRPQGGE